MSKSPNAMETQIPAVTKNSAMDKTDVDVSTLQDFPTLILS